MKFILYFLYFFVCLAWLLVANYVLDPYGGFPKSDKLAYALIAKSGKRIGKEYGLSICGLGGGIGNGESGKIGVLIASFDLRRPILKDEARQLIIQVTEEFLKDINANEELKSDLYNVPCTIKNVEVRIFCSNFDGRDIFDPYIGVVSCLEGKLDYLTNDPEDSFKYKNKSRETYEEGLAILQQERQN